MSRNFNRLEARTDRIPSLGAPYREHVAGPQISHPQRPAERAKKRIYSGVCDQPGRLIGTSPLAASSSASFRKGLAG